MSFWPIFFFKNKSGQTLEFSATTSQDPYNFIGTISPSTPPNPSLSAATNKTKALIPVPYSMSPRKNPGFCFRIKQNDDSAAKALWSDPPIVVGPRSLPEGVLSSIT